MDEQENEFCEKANKVSRPAQIVTPQQSHINGKVGEAAANPDSETYPRSK